MVISFRTKLIASHAAVALAVGAVALLVIERSVSNRMEIQVDSRLEAQARAVAKWLERAGHPERLAPRLAGVVGARVTIIDEDGVAIGESQQASLVGLNFETEGPALEVAIARRGGVGRGTRYSAVEGEPIRYIAVGAPNDAVVRLGLPMGQVDETRRVIRRQLGAGALASLLVAVALAALVAGALTRRLRATSALAHKVARGDYEVSSLTPSGDEIGLLSQTLVGAARELQETDARRRLFLANVAHEIRTPVTSIRGYAETLAGRDIDPETRAEFVQTIHRNAVRISKLVSDLLELEALAAGKGPELASDDVELGAVVRNVVATVDNRASEISARIDVDVSDDLTARGDADAIERIVLNLVDNALRYAGDGVTVTIAAEQREGRTVMTIRDDGPGIPEKQRKHIFERFVRGQADSTRKSRGSGLGLAIARELASTMRGDLTLADQPEPGAVFTLDLPS